MRRRTAISARRRAQFEALIEAPVSDTASASVSEQLGFSATSTSPGRPREASATMQNVATRLRMLARLATAGLHRAQRMHAAHTSAKRMRVLETVAFGEKRFAALLQVDGAQFLVGGGAAGVSLLAMLPATDVPASGLPVAAIAPAEAGHFSATMAQTASGAAPECAP